MQKFSLVIPKDCPITLLNTVPRMDNLAGTTWVLCNYQAPADGQATYAMLKSCVYRGGREIESSP